MGQTVRNDTFVVAEKLGTSDSILRIFSGNPARDLYDQHGGIPEHVAAENHQNPWVISERRSGVEAALPGTEERRRKMATKRRERMGGGIEPIRYIVGGSDPRRFSQCSA